MPLRCPPPVTAPRVPASTLPDASCLAAWLPRTVQKLRTASSNLCSLMLVILSGRRVSRQPRLLALDLDARMHRQANPDRSGLHQQASELLCGADIELGNEE